MSQDLVKALGVTISSAEYIAASLRSGAPIHNEYVSVASLRAAIEKLPVVEGKITFVGTPDNKESYAKFEVVDKPHCTHTALLFAIEEIKKEPVKVKLYEYLVYSPKNNSMRSAKPRWFKSDEEFRKSFDKAYPIIKTGREVTVEEIVGE